MSLKICSLYSGSKGNAFLIGCNDDCILIDAGKSARRLCEGIRRCGYSPEQVRAIFVTHEHSDHIQALPVFLKKYPIPVHILESCSYRLESVASVGSSLICHPTEYTETVGPFLVRSFQTPHDSCGSVGFRVEIHDGCSEYILGYATDIGYVTQKIKKSLLGCQAVILESNHDVEMLKNGIYPDDLKKRIRSKHGHLSNEECADLASLLAENGTECIMLAHLSQENNTPELAYDETFARIADDRFHLCVADAEEPTLLLQRD